MLAKRNGLKFTIGYSQRFNPKIAYAKKKIVDGTLGNVVSVLVSRHLVAQPGQEDRQPRAAVAGGDGVDARSRFRVLAVGAGQARARLQPRRLWLHEAGERLARRDVHHRHHGQRRGGDDRRRLEPAAELSRIIARPGSRSPAPKARSSSTTPSATTGSTPSRAARNFRCRPCRASGWTTCLPAAWGRRPSISWKPASATRR